MKIIIRTILVGGVTLLLGALPVIAETITPNPSTDYYYLFSLHSSAGTLTANNPAYQIMTGTRPTVSPGAYTLTIIDHLGKATTSIAFSAAAGTVKVPVAYQSTGVRAVITKNGATVLSIDTSLSSTCNQDGVCSTAVGEDQYQCPSDCFSSIMTTPQPTAYTPVYSSSTSPVPVTQGTSVTPATIRLGILGVVGMVALVVLAVWHQHWMRPRGIDSDR